MMNHRIAVTLALGLVHGAAGAEPRAEFLQDPVSLSWVISAQGNRAMADIRTDLRNSLQRPVLPQPLIGLTTATQAAPDPMADAKV